MRISRRQLRVVGVSLALMAAGCSRAKNPVAATADESTRRSTKTGGVVGFRSAYGSDVWAGMPFAKPPIAERRWRAPEPPDAWSGVRPALAHGTPCTQFASAAGRVEGKEGEPAGSEDCLYLTLWAPHFADGNLPAGADRLPVMVWIHGGGNTVGFGGFYDGGNLAATENVIVVAINYRLGPFGWFRHAALRDGNAVDDSGNYGTLDIVRSLEWVRDNAAAFGGDPNNVTVFGESAGGTNTFSMLLSPKARGLFHRAIVQSGGVYFATQAEAENLEDDPDPGSKSSSNEVLLRLLIADGKAKDRDGAKQVVAEMGKDEVAVYLRGKAGAEILDVYEPMPGFGMFEMPEVFADGEVVPIEDPLQRLARADGYNAVPVMLGTNRDENKLFMFGDPKLVRRLFWIAPRLRDERMYNVTAEYMAKMWKATGADQPAAAMRENQENVFVYRFDWDEEPRLLGADLSVMLGAAHILEVPFVFGHFDIGGRSNLIFTEENLPGRRELSAQMMSYWAEFARHGSPGAGGKKDLPAWTSAPSYMILDTKAGGGLHLSPDALTADAIVAAVETDPRLTSAKERCDIWQGLARWSRGFSRRDYDAIAQCRDFPYESPARG